MVSEIQSETDKILCYSAQFFALKKKIRDIIILHMCTINEIT